MKILIKGLLAFAITYCSFSISAPAKVFPFYYAKWVSAGWRIEGDKAIIEAGLPSGTRAKLIVDGQTYQLTPGNNRLEIHI